MLRIGALIVLVVAVFVYMGARGRTSARASIQHTCGLTDRQFIENYEVQLQAVGMYGDDYLHGTAKAAELIQVSQEAARAVRSSAPFDPSLQTVRQLAPAMFLDYADAVRTRSQGGNASRQMYLAYVVGARVQDTLREARPGLTAAGCDLTSIS